MIRRPPRSTLFPYNDALPISPSPNYFGDDTFTWRVTDADGGISAPFTTQRSDRKSTRLNSSHVAISYAVFCLKKKKIIKRLIDVLSKVSGSDARRLTTILPSR